MPLTLPLPQLGKIIGRPYQGTHTRGNWQSDNAVDISTPEGTPVYAVEAGRIGTQLGPLSSSEPALAGNRVNLAGVSGDAYYYAHLSRYVVLPGQQVKAGQLLGYSGSANGVPHLHFAVEHGDPLSLLSGGAQPSGTGGDAGAGSSTLQTSGAAGLGCIVTLAAQVAAVVGFVVAGAWLL